MPNFSARLARLTATLAFSTSIALAASWAQATTPGPVESGITASTQTEARGIVGLDLRRNQQVVLGQRLVAGPGSGRQFKLQDGTQVVIGPNSVLTVDEFAADRIVLRLERGSFHIDSANPGHVHLILPNGRVDIRSAVVGGKAGPDGSDVVLLSAGRVDVSGFGGRPVRLDTLGQSTRILALGAPSAPARLAPEKLQEFGSIISQVAFLG